ncbi:MAG: DsbC family protein [Candidatus Competibacteraceae bacterium]|nr:DsbC family protein [Candidatus Competibacteraceae bacterium]
MIAVLYAAGSLAAETPSSEPAAPALGVVPVAIKQPDLTKLQAAVDGEQPDSVTPTAISGLFEVVLGGQVFYLSEDGRFVLQGDLLDLNSRANLTDLRRSELRGKALEAIDEKDMVVFAPKTATRHTVTVFTDVDCGYCRKMHSQMAAYLKEGIKIRYLMFPREGINSDSFNKAVSVWCADDRQDAMTKAKRGEQLERKTCDNPVQAQFELGQKLGVRGTPSMILEDGEMIPGYVPPGQLAQLLIR